MLYSNSSTKTLVPQEALDYSIHNCLKSTALKREVFSTVQSPMFRVSTEDRTSFFSVIDISLS